MEPVETKSKGGASNGSKAAVGAAAATKPHRAGAATHDVEPLEVAADAGTSTTTVRKYETFESMPLRATLLRGIFASGLERPSPVQQVGIVPVIRGGDVIVQAQSGTGKTATFSIGVLQRVDVRAPRLQAIVLEPTQELALQTHGVLRALGEFERGGDDDEREFCGLFVGGTAVQDDIAACRAHGGPAVAVGCPGRVLTLLQRGVLRADSVVTLVLDEADELLSEDFLAQVREIFRYMPREVQMGLFSATLPEATLKLTERFMRAPTSILVPREELSLKGIAQYRVALRDDVEKLEALTDLYSSVSIAQSVIFVRSKVRAAWLAEELERQHFAVALMHAGLDRRARREVMRGFREGVHRVLITSDVVARGIDVQHVNIVINFDVAPSAELYLHRIGRSGRYGRRGLGISFVTPREAAQLAAIEAHFGVSVGDLPEDFLEWV